MSTHPLIGIGHLTMLDVAPPAWVTLAAEAGFDAVGIRVAPVVPAEVPWPMGIGSPMLAETRRRLADTGVTVLDVEIVRLAPDSDPAAYEALFEVGALLGASFVNVMGDDPDLMRIRDNFHLLAEKARPYGLRPVIEPMTYLRVRNLEDAVFVAAGSGGGVTIDPLHLRRFGATPDELRSIDSRLLLYYQLCDAPLAGPSGPARSHQLPGGQSMDFGDARYESRSARLLPGEGELPLAEIVAAMPADIPVSVEAPNVALRDEIGALAFARRARAGVARLLSMRSEAQHRR
jgi:sugar phosphate isomerase/epimerase